MLLACSQNPEIDSAAVEDFIVVRQLEQVKSLRMSVNTFRDIARPVGDYHLRYKSGTKYYLVAFAQRCSLQFGGVTTDERNTSTVLQAHADTIRGCRISRIYRMSKEDTEELRALGRPPRNPN